MGRARATGVSGIGLALAGTLAGCIELPNFGDTEWTTDLPNITTIDADSLTSPATSIGSIGHTAGDATTDTGAVDTSTGADDSSTGEPTVCEPLPDAEVEAFLVIDNQPAFELGHTEIQTSCVVSWVGSFGTAIHVGLGCDDGAHSLDVADIDAIDLFVGDVVELSVYVDAPWWANAYAALRRDGELVLAAMDAEALPGAGEDYPAADFFAPLSIGLIDDACPPEPPQAEPCDFICPEICHVDERLALVFFIGAHFTVIYDHAVGALDELSLAVGTAVEHVEVLCPDTAGGRITLVAVRTP